MSNVTSYSEHVLASLSDGLVVVDETFSIVVFNPAIEEMLGWSASKALHRPLQKVFAQPVSLYERVVSTFRSGKVYANQEEILQRRDGSELAVSITSSPLFNSEGDIIGVVLLIRDRSRFRVLEEEARRIETLTSFATLAASVAHEIKNPLLGIRGTAQLLQEELPSSALKEYTGVIIKEANRLNTLVETLLNLTRPQPLKREPHNIHQILERVLFLLKSQAQEKKILFHPDYDPSLPEIWLDEERMVQVFVNLLQNSLEAMESGGEITITTKVATEYQLLPKEKQEIYFALIEIQDQGIGIPDTIQENLFTPFFTTKRQGSGLGLVISHRIISDHGGRLLLKSQEGKGTVASVYLPIEIRHTT